MCRQTAVAECATITYCARDEREKGGGGGRKGVVGERARDDKYLLYASAKRLMYCREGRSWVSTISSKKGPLSTPTKM